MALAVGLALGCALAGGCGTTTAAPADQSVNGPRDGGAFQECSSVCLRPGDCAVAFPDGNLCPPGFLCSRTFQCGRD